MEKNEIYGFFSLLFRQKYIKRWSLMRCGTDESLSTHTMETAVVAHCLALINREVLGGDADCEKVALYALFHDASEVLCGDLPTPVKYYNEEIRSIYGKIEQSSAETLLEKLPEQLQPAYRRLLHGECDELTRRLVKTADKLCALIKCTEELKFGNSEFKKAKQSVEAVLRELDSAELRYFREHFLPAFSLTIDEL